MFIYGCISKIMPFVSHADFRLIKNLITQRIHFTAAGNQKIKILKE
jgi:hypothetical protein